MTDTLEHRGEAGSRIDHDRPAIIVSCDGHIGPRLVEDLRPYCPAEHLDDFDDFVRARRGLLPEMSPKAEAPDRGNRNLSLEGHHDVQAYVRDMDVEGVAAEVLFQGSQNGEGIPFMPLSAVPSGNPNVAMDFLSISSNELAMFKVGQMIYNRWLADAVSVAPGRLLGLVHVAYWDAELAAEQVAWARENGLKGVNFPAPRPGLPHYSDPAWDPLWRACEEHDLTLANHAGAGDPTSWTGVAGRAIAGLESAGWPARRALHFMIFSAVFVRFPELRVIFTEQPGMWWTTARRDFDSIWKAPYQAELREHLPEPPSYYMDHNAFIGASFLSSQEAEDAVDNGYVSRVVWGRDYPHTEGTFQAPEFEGDPPQSPLALRDALQGCDPDDAAAMAGLNGATAYGLDLAQLQEVADRIGALTPNELVVAPESIPESHGFLTFRKNGAYS